MAVLVGLAAFGLFGLTTSRFVGYESETAAVAEGLVKAGQPRVLPGSPLAVGLRGRNGRQYGRAGLAEPAFEAPLYWLGQKLDDSGSKGRNYRWRVTLLQLYNPIMAALAVAAIFVLLTLRGIAERRALLITALCAAGTLIWPYSKIGMDTTVMAMFAVTVAAAAWVVRRPTAGRSAVLGVAVALTMNSKPYGALLVLGALPLVAGTYLQLLRERRAAALAACAGPIIAGLAVLAWYNWYRTGSITQFGEPYQGQEVLGIPVAAVGLLVSPGKGLLFYSPLVVLGLLGLRELRRSDLPLTSTIVLTVALNIAFIATSRYWGDETWGPRYLVPSAWLLVLPIAWWLTGRGRTRWLIAVAAVAVCIQFVAVFASYAIDEQASSTLAGQQVYGDQLYGPTKVPYGDDGPRWIPLASPLLLQTELTLADLKEGVTGSGFVVHYQPFRGYWAFLDLRHPDRIWGPLPDFWWNFPGTNAKQDLLAVLLAALFLTCIGVLLRGEFPGRGVRPAPRSRSPVGAAS